MDKRFLYKTAYSPLFQCFVGIQKAHTDVDGNFIFTCQNEKEGLSNHLFRETELERFCL